MTDSRSHDKSSRPKFFALVTLKLSCLFLKEMSLNVIGLYVHLKADIISTGKTNIERLCDLQLCVQCAQRSMQNGPDLAPSCEVSKLLGTVEKTGRIHTHSTLRPAIQRKGGSIGLREKTREDFSQDIPRLKY